MRSVTCYVPGQLRVETVAALALEADFPTDFVEIDPEDPRHYARTLRDYWASGEDFMVVEPDIVVRADVIDAFQNCSCGYGCFPYAWLTDVGPALGCTWFRASFTARYPHAMQETLDKRVLWNQVDVILMRHVLARKHKEQPHVHLPAVVHLNPDKQLMEGRTSEPLMTVPLW